MRNLIDKLFHKLGYERKVDTVALNTAAKAIHQNNIEKGFYDVITELKNPEWSIEQEARFFTLIVNEKLLLISTEITEIVEELRQEDINWTKVANEIADVMIRTMDVAEVLEVDIEDALTRVMTNNLERPRMHGKMF